MRIGGPYEGNEAVGMIRAMFDAIDGARWEELPRYFAEDCVYERPGYAAPKGIAALLEFYRDIRIIGAGRHRLDRIISSGEQAVAVGQFEGADRDGRTLSERFADVYRLSGGRISKRTTYFFRPAI